MEAKPGLKLGLIAGNGRFPFLLLDAARAQGVEVVVVAIREEAEAEMDTRGAADAGVQVNWISLGELSRLIEIFHQAGVTRAVMAGQIKHKQIFSSIRPDWQLAKLILNLRTRNTDMLLGAVAKVLSDQGIELISSTSYLEPLLAPPGVLTARSPTAQEQQDIDYGRSVARAIAGYDIGQTVIIASQAVVAVEAMEGTDAAIQRAGEILNSGAISSSGAIPATLASAEEASALDRPTLGRRLTVVKVAKPQQDMRFDVPVIGLATIQTMQRAGATCLALEAGRTLIFDRDRVCRLADAAGIAIVAAERQSEAQQRTRD